MIGLIVLWVYCCFEISSERFWFQIHIELTERLSIYFDRVELHSIAPWTIAPIILGTGCTQSIVHGPHLGNIAVYGSV
jgi:hypothetical protein